MGGCSGSEGKLVDSGDGTRISGIGSRVGVRGGVGLKSSVKSIQIISEGELLLLVLCLRRATDLRRFWIAFGDKKRPISMEVIIGALGLRISLALRASILARFFCPALCFFLQTIYRGNRNKIGG